MYIYRGHDYPGQAQVYITGQCGSAPAGQALRKRKKRRSAVEPKIGHLKSDNRMGRNFLKGIVGDQINAMLAGIGANFRKLRAFFWPALSQWMVFCIFPQESVQYNDALPITRTA